VAAGCILLDGQDLAALEALRRDRMAMIFQEPLTSLNPVITVGECVAKSLRIHRGLSRAAALECAAGEPAWRGAGRLSPRGGTQPRRIGRCTRMNATLRSESRLPAQ
jgi:ABC-type dipeptide/oligopeptide/nickel transport system ATPase component